MMTMKISAQIKYVFLSVFLVFATISFTKTTLDIVKSSKRIDDLNAEVSELEKQKSGLEAEIGYKKTDEYIEERARNDLSLIKPGEEVFVVIEKEEEGAEDLKGGTDAEAKAGIGRDDYKDNAPNVNGVVAGDSDILSKESTHGLTSIKDSNLYLWYKLFF